MNIGLLKIGIALLTKYNYNKNSENIRKMLKRYNMKLNLTLVTSK